MTAWQLPDDCKSTKWQQLQAYEAARSCAKPKKYIFYVHSSLSTKLVFVSLIVDILTLFQLCLKVTLTTREG